MVWVRSKIYNDKWTNYFALGPRQILHATRRRLMLILHYSFTWLRTKDIFEAKITSFLVQVAIQITLRLCNVARATFALYNIYCRALVSKNIRIIIHEKKHLGTQITAVWEHAVWAVMYANIVQSESEIRRIIAWIITVLCNLAQSIGADI